MKFFHLKTMLLATFLIMAAAVQSLSAATQVWFTLDRPFPAVYPGAIFTTDLKISGANGVVGAIDVILRYDASVLNLVEFTATPNSSGFDSNCFMQPPGIASGQTRVACFQTLEVPPPGNPRTLGTIKWEVIGPVGSQTSISIEPITVTDIHWSSVEVMKFSQQITVSPRVDSDTDDDITILADTILPVYWYYTRINNNWYIVDAIANLNPAVLLLESVDSNVEGGIRWKPINNYPASAGFPAADTTFSSVTVSPDGRAIQFGTLILPQTDPDVTVLANTTQFVYWFYTAINDMSKWYVIETRFQSDPAVLLLKYVDPDWEGGIRWKPISNYPSYAGFPAAPVNYQSISISKEGKTIAFGNLK